MKKIITTALALVLLCMGSWAQAQNEPTDRSLYFDGYDDYIKILNTQNVPPSNNPTIYSPTLTVEAWVKICDINGTNTIVSKAYCNAGKYAYHLFVTDGKLAWQTYDNGDCTDKRNRVTTRSAVISEGTWHHVAVSHDGTNEIVFLYVDGVAYDPLDGTETDTIGTIMHPIGPAQEPIRVGLIRPAGTTVSGAFHGNMDDVMIFHEARSSAQIAADLISSTPPSHNGTLKIFLDMDIPAMGRDKLIPNLIGNTFVGTTKDYLSTTLSRPLQTPFTIYNDTEICCSPSSSNRVAQPETEVAPVDNKTLFLSPNPNQGEFELHWSKDLGQKGQMKVINMVTGQEVFEGKVTSGQRFNIGTKPTGVYMVTVLTETGEFLSTKTISNLK